MPIDLPMKKALGHLLELFQKPSTQADAYPAEQRYYSATSASQRAGERGEQMARKHLEQHGLRYVDSNVASTLGEIDLIMRDGAVWVFVEVKMRRSEAFGGAVAAITLSKLARLRKAIDLYVQQNPSCAHSDCRIDAVLIQGVGAQRQIEWLRNIGMD